MCQSSWNQYSSKWRYSRKQFKNRTTRHGIEIDPKIELQIVEIQLQHEGTSSLLKNAYQSSDIKLDLSVKNGKTIMHYYGKATTFAAKEENYDTEAKFDFAIDGKIIKIK